MSTQSRRTQPRVDANISVKVALPGGPSTTTQRIRNISLGGLFIEMNDPVPFGTELALEFDLPVAPRHIRCKGFVVWSTKTAPERAKGMQGIGVRLMDIGIADMRLLAQYVEKELA